MAITIDRAKPQERGAAMGTFTTSMDLGIGIGSVVWGLVAEAFGYQVMYVVAGFMGLVGGRCYSPGLGGGRPAPALWLPQR